uniref:Ornithine decarboxylase n=1 Tax=Ditylenchus dipsaci TaxID=166011 RepID=A0A915CXQ2_9BILA
MLGEVEAKIHKPKRMIHLANDTDANDNSSQSLQFARQIAALKNVQSYSEPFYVMDMAKVNDLIEQCDAVLLKLLANNRYVGFNCMNNQNLDDALELVSSDRILYSNPLWTRAALKQAAAKDVQLLTFESSRDLDRIMLNHPTAELLLHICVNHQSQDTNALMGCEVKAASELLQLAASSGANVVGVSFNLGSGDVTPALYSTAILAAAKLFELGSALGLSMTVLNIGCGFSSLDKSFEKTCAFINDSLDYYFPLDSFPQLRIMATPGRFFAGAVFSLVTNIVERRLVDLSNITNDDFDTGRDAFIYQTNEGYYGGFGCRVNANIDPECVPLFDHYLDNFSAEHVYGSVIGPTFESHDVVQPICRFRPLSTGDWLLWNNMGAYSLNNEELWVMTMTMPLLWSSILHRKASGNEWTPAKIISIWPVCLLLVPLALNSPMMMAALQWKRMALCYLIKLISISWMSAMRTTSRNF